MGGIPFHPPLQDCNLELLVCDQNLLAANSAIGLVVLGANRRGSEALHWLQLLENPRRIVIHWHELKVCPCVGVYAFTSAWSCACVRAHVLSYCLFVCVFYLPSSLENVANFNLYRKNSQKFLKGPDNKYLINLGLLWLSGFSMIYFRCQTA